jgi:uncharacterized protein YndB with AHSA1/START domain
MINDKMIVKVREFNIPLESLWWKWTTKEGLLSFSFGYDNKVELKVNGAYEIYFIKENPEGDRGGEGNKILSYIPHELLSFTWTAHPDFVEVRNHPHRTWVVMYFEKIDENKSRLTVKHLGWLDGEEWDMVYEYFIKAWDTGLGWLDDSI